MKKENIHVINITENDTIVVKHNSLISMSKKQEITKLVELTGCKALVLDPTDDLMAILKLTKKEDKPNE